MEKRSILILGKGPSVLKCTREFVDKYQDIAICGFPPLNEFFSSLINGKIINHHFCNCGSYDKRYTDKINEKLKLENIYNTNTSNNYINYIKNKQLFKDIGRSKLISFFKEKYNLNPSTGTMAIQYIIETNKYDKIGLVGFDNFKKGEQTYYFKPKEYSDEGKRVIRSRAIKKDGTFNIVSGHNPDKTESYFKDILENKNIIITRLK